MKQQLRRLQQLGYLEVVVECDVNVNEGSGSSRSTPTNSSRRSNRWSRLRCTVPLVFERVLLLVVVVVVVVVVVLLLQQDVDVNVAE
jgi:t-SNARE complex subunit (syntaxin)